MLFTSAFVLGLQVSAVLSLPTNLKPRLDLSDLADILDSLNGNSGQTEGAGKVESPSRAGVAAPAVATPLVQTTTLASAAATATGKAGAGAGAGKAGEAKAGGAKAGEAKAGEAKTGEAKAGEAKAGEAKAGEAKAGEAKAGEGKAGEEEEEGNEVNLKGIFGKAVAVQGGDIKQDILFTKSAIGAFEYEFQAATADSVTVTENKTPAAPPSGFVAIEPSSFKVALTSKGEGLTLSKIDYIFDGTNAALAAMDLTTAKVGKLCTETGSFIIDEALGEVEFEAEENEVTLNLNKAVTAQGEWGIFLPVAAGAAGAAAGAANATAGADTGAAKAMTGAE